jgi:hypothetical protein
MKGHAMTALDPQTVVITLLLVGVVLVVLLRNFRVLWPLICVALFAGAIVGGSITDLGLS